MARERPQRPVRQRPRRPGLSDGDAEEYQGLIQEVHDMIGRERLHVPTQLEEPPPVMPFDLTELSDGGLQSLYSAFGAYAYRTGYLLMLEESKEMKCRQAADEIVTAYLGHNAEAKESITALKARAEQDENVQVWRKRQRMHGTLADSLRKQRDNYDKCCERLSRLETMRMNEFERAGSRLANRVHRGPRPVRK